MHLSYLCDWFSTKRKFNHFKFNLIINIVGMTFEVKEQKPPIYFIWSEDAKKINDSDNIITGFKNKIILFLLDICISNELRSRSASGPYFLRSRSAQELTSEILESSGRCTCQTNGLSFLAWTTWAGGRRRVGEPVWVPLDCCLRSPFI